MRNVLRRSLLSIAAVGLISAAACADEIPKAIAIPTPAPDAAPISAHAAPVAVTQSCRHPKVTYRHEHKLAKASRCNGRPIETILIVNDKCSSCCSAIPVCIPECCLTEACTSEHKGLLGRRVIEYSWPCGFKLEIVMRLRGDVLVRYHGA